MTITKGPINEYGFQLEEEVIINKYDCFYERINSEGRVDRGGYDTVSVEGFRSSKWRHVGRKIRGANHDAEWIFRVSNDPWTTFFQDVGSDNGTLSFNGPLSYVFRLVSPTEVLNLPTNFEFDALINLRNQLADAKLNTLVNLGELPETVEYVTGVAERIAKSFTYVKKKKWRRAIQELGVTEIGSTHLEYRYALNPLLSSVSDTVRALADRYDKEKDIVMVQQSRNHNDSCAASGPADPLTIYLTRMRTYRVKYTVYARVTGPGLRAANQLGFVNLPVAAWELIPLSFVADWFLPIGDYLETLTATLGLSFVTGHVTSKDFHKTYGGGYSHEHTAYQRTMLTEFPFPSFPQLHADISLNRLFDAMALMKAI